MDALHFGSLDNVSAFPFENYLQSMKKLVRGQKLQLEQVARRIVEIDLSTISSHAKSAISFKTFVNKKGYCRKIIYNNMVISRELKDNCFLTKSGDIVIVHDIILNTKIVQLICKKILNVKPVTHYPFPSSKLLFYQIKEIFGNAHLTLPIECLMMKMVKLPLNGAPGKFLCIPLLQNF